MRRNKYGNRKVEVHGIPFDSKKESEKYLELWALQKVGEIKNLKLQPKYLLIPKQEPTQLNSREQATYYIADFEFWELKDGKPQKVVTDIKSEITRREPSYIIKRKLFKLQNPDIEFREV